MNTSVVVSQFRLASAKYASRAALIGPEMSVSYNQLERQSAAMSEKISALVSGPTVALLIPNSPVFGPSLLGALWAGKTVAVLPTLAPPPMLKLMVSEVGAGAVLTTADFAPRLAEAGIPHEVVEGIAELDPESVPVRPMEQEAAVLLYTSGTTGRPKAVMLSERNLLENIDGCRMATGFNDRQVMLAILPLFHAYGLTVTLLLPLTSGATVVIPDRFVPRSVLQTIETHRVTCLVAVPSQYRLLTKEPVSIDARSLWLCIAGAERLPEQVATEFQQKFGRPIVQGYGATELSPVVSLNMPGTNRFGSVGKSLPNLRVTIRDDEDALLGPDDVGEVCVEGGAVMLGYFRDELASAKKVRHGILHTGDKGYIDWDGYLHLVGRADDLVKVSGEKVYPSEVETALESLAGVDEAAVLALPDERHGSRLHAFVLLKDAGVTENDLRTGLRDRLEAYKVPRTITLIEQMPRTITGKTDKRTLAASAV